MTTYFEKLKDPRWQKKRLEVLSSREFRCEVCGDDSQTLHVHHKQYFKGREPWDYEAKQLSAVCETCHEESHHNEDPLLLAASFVQMDGPRCRQSVASLIAGFCDLGMSQPYATPDPDSYVIGQLADALSSWPTGALTIVEKIRLVELASSDLTGLTEHLRSYLKQKESV